MIDTWETSSIGALFEIGAGKSVTPKSRSVEPRFPFLRTANVFWGRIDLTEVDQMHFTEYELEEKSLRPGDLLVCEGGDIGRAAIWNGGLKSCAFQNHLHRLRPRSDEALPEFYRFYLEAGVTMLGLLDGIGNRTTIPNLSRNRLAGLEVPKPPRDEQQKIAAVLGKVQTAVEVEGELIRVTRELKQAALRQLFTRGLRNEPQKRTDLGPIPESWDVVPLSAVASFASGGTPSKNEPLNWSGEVPWVSPKDMKRPRLAGTIDHITKQGLEAGSRLVPQGSILVVIRGMILMRDVPVALTMIPMAFNQDMKAILPGERLSAEFLLYAFEAFRPQLFSRVGTSAHGTRTLASSALENFSIPAPDPDEQREIADHLAAIDAKLAHHEARRKLLRELFRTLLRDLMTARRRVTHLDLPDHFADANKMVPSSVP